MQSNEIMLSIIVPAYNVENYLRECLDSLLKQELPLDSFEVICIDDGSTDNCGYIIDEYAKKFGNLIGIHQENQGVSSARNKGLKVAKGKYIWFVDSDDLIAYGSISEILDGLQTYEYPDILYIGVRAFEDNKLSNCCFEILPIECETPEYKEWIFTEIIKSRLINENCLRFDENVFFGEDDIFCVFVDQYARTIERLNKVAYYYRQREGSALHSAITESNIERYIKTFYSDLQYAANYEFFWYKKDVVLNFLPNIMCFIAEQNFSKGKIYINILKRYSLFPLKKYKDEFRNKMKNEKMSGAKKIRIRACESYINYIILRLYNNIQRKISRIK